MVTKYDFFDGECNEQEGHGADVKDEDYEALKAERDALAVENAALKESAADLRKQAFNGRRNSHNCGPFQYSDLCESIIESTKVETPATAAALAAIEARGVEKAIDLLLNKFSSTGHIGVHVMVLESLAKQLREETK